MKQNERKQKRKKMVEDIDLGRFFDLTTSNKIYVNSLNLREIKIEISLDYTGNFELIKSMLVGEI